VDKTRRILLGHISQAHGIKGEVLIKSHTAAAEDIASYGVLTDKSGQRSFTLTSARATQKGVVARIAGVADRNAAEALKGTELYIPRDQLPEAAPGEYYHADLIGLAAVDEQGQPIGTITAVMNFGAGDILEVELAAGGSELVPFSNEAVPEVDIAAGRVVVRLSPPSEDLPE
jgi:16S rRNA processing protein RimM